MSTSDESKPIPVLEESIPEEEKPTATPKSPARIILATWITITNILSFGSLLPWATLVLCSMMSYPTEEKDFSYYSFRAAIYAYPFAILGLAIFAWYAYKKGWNLAAQITSIVSILPVVWFVFLIFSVM